MKHHFRALDLFRLSLPDQQLHESLPHAKDIRRFSTLTSDELYHYFKSRENGLTDSEVHSRIKRYGLNIIADKQKKHLILIFLSKFKDPLTLMLLVLAAINVFYIEDFRSASVIGGMTLISVILSFTQEIRSGKAAEKLNAIVSSSVTVRRFKQSDDLFEIPLSMLVPGDIIHLGAGDIVPADIRILVSKDLFVNQSTLTGEALPVEKFPESHEQATDTLFDLANICYMGSNIESGTAIGIVLQTGKETYVGSIASSLQRTPDPTTFDIGIQKFTWMMMTFMLIMAPLVIVVNGLLKHNWAEAFLFGLSVAVGLAPEMLPMIVTVNLAKGALNLSRKKVIVKNLHAIQNFGAMDVLCTDKTGTLTQDTIILERHIDIAGNDNAHVIELAYLNSHYQTGLKNLLDTAVLKYAQYEHLPMSLYTSKIDEIPFDFIRKRMSVIVEKNDVSKAHLMITKGAVEEILPLCTAADHDGSIVGLDESMKKLAFQTVQRLNEDGFRVIAVASKEVSPVQTIYSSSDESALILNGFIAFLDPPKESAKGALEALALYGVTVKVLTGDNDIVTRKICHDVGLAVSGIYKGSQIDAMSDDALKLAVEEANLFVKLSPDNKARIVHALNQNGHTTGFLGDGINDAPALRMADVGLSVDTATDIAKESADMILLEKSLLVLQEGVVSGREVFGNIVKYIKMGASSNFGNMFSVLGASIFLPFLPMRPIQILTNNFLYDLSQAATPTDNVDPEFIAKPRKWDIDGLRRFMFVMGPVSSLFDYILFAVMLYVFNGWHNQSLFQTGWFVESLVSQIMIVHILRTDKIPFIQSMASAPVLIMTSLVMVLAIWLPYSLFSEALGLSALPQMYWPILFAMMLGYVVLAQAVKTWYNYQNKL
ncbi:MAG: magnesium-translocating P-type ATPase [Sulfurimonas sp.]|uniref:magnesium-translocating P-type ATPase n=1 Tax=Sulfurimonas sp. TaxID=2022749 RepID=UPI002623889A|nr:magnesium-translocating P-type ATPase [Sulfurimonas sp.]MDD5401071.1 magnesium-translocating P-type ATPase [Sulfurimonas sp.]